MSSPPKVLLVAPPWLDVYGDFQAAAKIGCVSPPLGLAYLAAATFDAGGECRVVDMEPERMSASDLLSLIAEYRPNLVGLTATSPVYHNAQRLAGEIKRRFPEIPLAIGGVHATIVGRQVLEDCESFDLAVVGEGEETMREIVRALATGGGMAGISGVIFRSGNEIVKNAPRPLRAELDDTLRPARRSLNLGLYHHYLPGKGLIPYATIFTSRGCPYRCTFCSQHTMYGRRVRWRSIESVIAELHEIVDELGIHHVIMMDETLTLDRKRTLALCQAIKDEGLDFTWEGWTHAATVDEELLRAMKSAGLIRLSFGIESGDPEVLERIKKNVTLEQIRRAFEIAAKVGIETRGSAILGHPFETRQTAWRTINFVRSISECQQIFLNVACPYPGTELYEYAVSGKGGMRLLTNDYARYKRYGDPVISVNDLGPKDLKRLQAVGLVLFYLTPRRVWYNVVKRAGPKAGFVNGLAFLRGVVASTMRTRLRP